MWCARAQGNFTNGWAYTFVLLVTFWILFSYLVPISLFVTLEIVKFWQARGLALQGCRQARSLERSASK